MSLHNTGPRRRLDRRVLAVLAAVVSTIAVSSVSARALSARASAEARMATATTRPHPGPGPGAGMILGGFTSQHWPVVIAVSKNGKRIDAFGSGLNMTCTSGNVLSVPNLWAPLPVSANGDVHAFGMIPPRAGATVSLTGGDDSLTGQLNRQRATFSGVEEMRVSFSMSDGQTDQCDSGRVTFTARL